jgi:hypothetical protein
MSFSDQDTAARDIWLGNICHSFGDIEATIDRIHPKERLRCAGLSGIDTLEVKPPQDGISTGYLTLRDVNDHAVTASRIVRIESMETMDQANRSQGVNPPSW